MSTEQKPTISKYKEKPYKCQKCGYEKQIGTNHFGECYSLGNYNRCPKCPPMDITTWECQEPCPDNMQKPAPWKTVKLGNICEIV
jgi:hypothetical protein